MPTGIVVFRGKAPADLGSELAVVRVVAGTRSFRALGKSARRRIHMLLDRLRASSKENDERVSLFLSLCVCVFVCPRSYHRAIFAKFFVYVTYGRGSVLLWRRSDMK